jgi:hypothetical protein
MNDHNLAAFCSGDLQMWGEHDHIYEYNSNRSRVGTMANNADLGRTA